MKELHQMQKKDWGENAVEEFLKTILQAEDKIRGKVETHKPILMQEQDWVDFKEDTHSHICEKALIIE